ncbi:MAG: ABC-F family ATP-binding cassette domain-containing protein [Caldilineaceae bacterium]|nr:ABC-F family ATP-binding cassette domain-containing protein [Caldilineaceae bacterium]
MSVITLNNLGQSYGDFDVFLGASGSIPQGGKVGLVGPNGIGKTTLLRILVGLDVSSAGSITLARDTRIGYLRQEAMAAFAGRDNTIYAEMLTVFRGLKELEKELHALQEQMAAGDASEALLAEYGHKHDAFERAGGYAYEVRISQVLDGLGFTREDWDMPLTHLSGGQKTRALLARLLLEQPDLLVLDEPTNHLDVEAIEWLENTLRTWDGAVLIVSHDRYFLDRVVDRIWEMSRSGMEEYRGNYSAYVVQRQERWERRESEFQTVRDTFLKELDYIKRNIARDSTRDQAVGRMRRLVRQVKAVEQGGVQILLNNKWSEVTSQVRISTERWEVTELEQHIKALQSPVTRPPHINMRLETNLRSGELVLRTSEMTVGYPAAPLFTADPLTLHRQECAAMIGPNGAGKTTFLRTIMEQLAPLAGEVRLGASLRVGYFAQAHDRLNPQNTVLDELLSHKHMDLGPARNHLARYLFRNDDVFKPISALSGGERGRLALAILALEGANFLLLDEPTNHLDIPAQEVLQTVLENFDGTILLVSHDRYLIDRLATQIWDLHDARLNVFEGSYTEFVAKRRQDAEAAKEAAVQERSTAKQDQRQDRRAKNEERKRLRQVEEMENKVHALEAELESITSKLEEASRVQDVPRIQKLSSAYAQTQTALERAMEAWADLAEE